MPDETDVQENRIRGQFPKVLETLLRDCTTKRNIFWATDNYRQYGPEYGASHPIKPELITGKRSEIITPRVRKSLAVQKTRSRDMAEVFTPAWVCNAQNNLIDDAWFGRGEVFNHERPCDGGNSWQATAEKISFPEGRSWEDYVADLRLEITCGEAPYITSRYDTTTGAVIPVKERVGILDRKLRIVSENCDEKDAWLAAAERACKSTYAYEWQGDSLLLAREAMFCTLLDTFRDKFGSEPEPACLQNFAEIISWNVWQMDGLKGVIPDSCQETVPLDLFADGAITKIPCEGCATGNIQKHTGIYCRIRDWEKNRTIKFADLFAPRFGER